MSIFAPMKMNNAAKSSMTIARKKNTGGETGSVRAGALVAVAAGVGIAVSVAAGMGCGVAVSVTRIVAVAVGVGVPVAVAVGNGVLVGAGVDVGGASAVKTARPVARACRMMAVASSQPGAVHCADTRAGDSDHSKTNAATMMRMIIWARRSAARCSVPQY